MNYNWKVFKWMVLAGFLPTIYFVIIRRFGGVNHAAEFSMWESFAIWSVISIFITATLSFFVFKEIIWLEKKLPWKKNPVKRILAEVPMVLITTTIGMLIISQFTYELHIKSFGCYFFNNYNDFIIKELTLT